MEFAEEVTTSFRFCSNDQKGPVDHRVNSDMSWGVDVCRADTSGKLFLLWRTCTTACPKHWGEAGRAIWFFHRGFGL